MGEEYKALFVCSFITRNRGDPRQRAVIKMALFPWIDLLDPSI